jgi:hypothetical protein
MTRRSILAQRLCLGSLVPLGVLCLAGLLLSRSLPPPAPTDSAQQLAHHFRHHTDAIKIGLLLITFSGTFFATWSGAIAVQLKRSEGEFSPFTYAEVALGGLGAIEFIIPMYFLLAAVFRPTGHPLDNFVLLSDIAWLMFVGVTQTVALQALVFAIAVLLQDPEKPVFPRWAAHVNFFCAAYFSASAFFVLAHHGVFAWNGLVGWWGLFAVFFGWMLVLTYLCFDALRRQEAKAAVLADVAVSAS